MVIDEKGNEQKWVAVYGRYHQHHEDEFDSLKEAKAFLLRGEEYGEISATHIVTPEGEIIEYDFNWKA